VAVVVGAVAGVVQARVDRRVRVVAVAADQRIARDEPAAPLGRRAVIAERVAVGVGPQEIGDALVHLAVAVVVDAVADLGRRAVHARRGVVAVGAAAQLTEGGLVAAARVGRAVLVEVAIAGGARVAVLVEVLGVADLERARMAPRVAVVAVVAAASEGDGAVAVGVGRAAEHALVGRLVTRGARTAGRGGRDAGARLAALEAVAEQAVVALGVG